MSANIGSAIPMQGREPAPANQQSSSTLEKVLEYQFLAGVSAELMSRGVDFEILRSDIDNFGHDLVIEASGTVRHIQLKGMVRGGKRARVTINRRLASKPSGCVIWMVYDPATFELESFRWFGGEVGEVLPELGDLIARHSKGTSKGVKSHRPLHRIMRKGQFRTIIGFPALVDQLFGPSSQVATRSISTPRLVR